MKKRQRENEQIRQSYEKTIAEQKERIFALREKLAAQELLAENYLYRQKAVSEALLSAEKAAEEILEEARKKAEALLQRAELAANKRNSELAGYRAELYRMAETCRRLLSELEGGKSGIRLKKSA